MDEIYCLNVVWLDMIIVTLFFQKEQEAGIQSEKGRLEENFIRCKKP